MYDNLTGEQIQIILDLFLYKALEPVVLHSTVFDTQVSYLLNLTTGNRKRKISSIERETVIELLASYLVVADRREKFEIVRSARIERSFIHTFLSRFQLHNSTFLERYKAYMVMTGTKEREIERECLDAMARQAGCAKREDLYRIMTLVDGYLRNFYSYRTVVVDHYIKKASKQAAQYIESNSSMHYDFKDVRQNILKSILIAIDKYDSDRGALTTYINWWSLNALTCGTDEHEYGIAYTIPQTQRKKLATGTSSEVNFSISLDSMANDDDENGERNLHNTVSTDEKIDHDIERSETDDVIRYLVKSVDHRGTARLILDIGEYFTADEIEKMDQQMRREFGHLIRASRPAPSKVKTQSLRSTVRKVKAIRRRAFAALTVNRDTTLPPSEIHPYGNR
jgi:hypothetical protein